MSKQGKKVTALSAAAVLAASAIVPVAATAAPAQAQEIDYVIFTTDSGKLASLPMEDYDLALGAGIVAVEPTHVQLTDGSVYDMDDFNLALGATNNLEEAIALLIENGSKVTSEVKPGEINDGKVVIGDETPEEKVNETFFYNLAA